MVDEYGVIKNVYINKEKEKELNSNHKAYRIKLGTYLIAITVIMLFIGIMLV